VLLLPGICAIILIGIDPHELVVDSMYFCSFWCCWRSAPAALR
jgi:hypothetical protein